MASLIYAHDPMCSWCWAFHPIWETIKTRVSDDIQTTVLLGGLAPDSEEPMPEAMKSYLQQTWTTIMQRVPGTQFNTDFWTLCTPRRSTWPACRAIIAAGLQQQHGAQTMSLQIQHAYYLQARNPSDTETLVELAQAMQLDSDKFKHDLHAASTHAEHQRQMAVCQSYGVNGYPSLVYVSRRGSQLISVDYNNAGTTLMQLEHIHSQSQ